MEIPTRMGIMGFFAVFRPKVLNGVSPSKKCRISRRILRVYLTDIHKHVHLQENGMYSYFICASEYNIQRCKDTSIQTYNYAKIHIYTFYKDTHTYTYNI